MVITILAWVFFAIFSVILALIVSEIVANLLGITAYDVFIMIVCVVAIIGLGFKLGLW